MTLIAFATYGKHAQIYTDTSCYTDAMRRTGASTKWASLAQMDAVLLCTGDHLFGSLAYLACMQLSDFVPDFDQFVTALPEVLREAWVAQNRPQVIIFLVGWSPARGRFTAWQLAYLDEFAPIERRDVHIHPSPLTVRPSDIEMTWLTQDGVDESDLAVLRANPKLDKPATRQEWLDLILAARERASLPMCALKAIVGGRVVETRLERGRVTSEVIREFDDSGEEWAQIISGTLHPDAQVGPCPCGSGRRFIDCHLPLDNPCCCGSGKPIRDCCAVTASGQTAVGAGAER